MKNTGKLHIERFLAAVVAEEDDKAEALVPFLAAADTPTLHEMATAEDANRRWWGMRALAQVGNVDSVAILAAALEDALPDLRAVSAMALGVLHAAQPTAVDDHLGDLAQLLADDNGQVRLAAVAALVHCGDAAVPVLSTALASDNEGVRVHAARALHGIGSLKVAPLLYHHLEDANPLVRHYAYETLDRLGLLENQLFRR